MCYVMMCKKSSLMTNKLPFNIRIFVLARFLKKKTWGGTTGELTTTKKITIVLAISKQLSTKIDILKHADAELWVCFPFKQHFLAWL